MRDAIRACFAAAAILAAAPAEAQVYPPPPFPPAAPRGEGPRVPDNALRGQIGLAAATTGYYCYYGYFGTCYQYASYGVTRPIANLELDLGLGHYTALDLGASVTWGTYGGIDATLWEPHVDLVWRGPPLALSRFRLRLGAALYVADSSNAARPGTGTGAALRLGGGISFPAASPAGIAVDAVLELGTFQSFYVSTFHLMVGPEFRF